MNVPDRIGPYLIDSVLGTGGMGIVYRARRMDTEAWCALKTVSRLGGERLELLRREIRALGGVKHPGIVRVLEQGVDRGCPWYAMELLEPVTFATMLDATRSGATPGDDDVDASVTRMIGPGPATELQSPAMRADGPARTDARAEMTGPQRVAKFVPTLHHLCAPLALLHGEGLVHCDLKPSNIFLRATGMPVIGDFGLASPAIGAQGREVLQVQRRVRGTFAYMAPEQIRQEPLDARTDLYALGCMLYEAVTGRPPFVGSYQEIITGHLSVDPVPVRDLMADVPEALGALIQRLLAKHPRHRIGFAEDIAPILEDICNLPPPDEGPRPRPYIYRSELVGRDADLVRLSQWVTESRAGNGRLVFLGGESGVGKTRLATEAGRRAASLDTNVITGQCSAPTDGRTAGAPLEPLLPLLRAVADRCTGGGASETARLLGARGPVLAAFERSLAALPGAETWPALARLEPVAAQRRLFDALLETMRVVAGREGLLLILDDLQWADPLTLAFLAMAAPRLAATNILVLGTFRTEEQGPALAALADTSACVLHMDRLDDTNIGSMVADMLAMERPSPGLVRFVARESEGNPFFVAEYLRAAIAERVIARDDSGRWQLAPLYAMSEDAYADALPLPTSLRELVTLRCAGLSEPGRDVLEMASVLGREFDPALLDATLDRPGDVLMDAVQELTVRHVLEHEAGLLRFVHHKIREFSYEAIPPADREARHRRAAEALDRRRAGERDVATHAELARHWSLGSRRARALEHYRLAAVRAAEVYANAQAIEYYRLAIAEGATAQAGDVTVVRALHEGLGDVLALTGRQADARDAYEAALAGTPAPAQATVHRKIGKTWESHHEHVESLLAYDRALAALDADAGERGASWWETWLRVRLDRMMVHYYRGAADLMELELQTVRPHMDRATPVLQAGFHEVLANLAYRRERYLLSAETVGHARRMYEASLASADQVLVAGALFELGFAQLFHGDTTAAADSLRQAWEHATRIGDVIRQVRSLTYLTICDRRHRRVSAVERGARACLETALDSGLTVYVAASQANLAWVAFTRGAFAEAEERGRSALEHWRRMDAAFPFLWLAALPLLALQVTRKDLAEALHLAQLLMAPEQQRLPPSLAAALDGALGATSEVDDAAVRTALGRVISAAGASGYL